MRFENAEQARSSAVARGTVRAMQTYPPHEILSFWNEWDDYDPALVSTYVTRIQPDNMRMFVTAPDLPDMDRTEPRYDVAWGIQPLDASLVQRWTEQPTDPGLALPPLNPFVPEDTSLLTNTDPSALPTAVVDERLRVWHLQDTTYVPRASVSAGVPARPRRHTRAPDPHGAVDPPGRPAPRLDARPGPHRRSAAQLQSHQDGMVVAARGYSDKLDVILDALVQGAPRPRSTPRPSKFGRDLLRRYRNTTTSRPIDQVGWAMAEAQPA